MRRSDSTSSNGQTRRAIQYSILAVALLVVAVGPVAGYAGGFAAPTTTSGGSTALSVSATDALETSDADSSQAQETSDSAQFTLSADVTAECGERCRQVSANLTNNGTETAHNVSTVTRITVDGERIWQRTRHLGNVSANESVERTARIEIGYVDALRIARNDGWITIDTTVYWADGNATFTERRQVD